MEQGCIGISDILDELLILVLRKLSNFDIFYSVQCVNQRLSKLIHDAIFSNRLSSLEWVPHTFINLISDEIMLNQFCTQILPSIHHLWNIFQIQVYVHVDREKRKRTSRKCL